MLLLLFWDKRHIIRCVCSNEKIQQSTLTFHLHGIFITKLILAIWVYLKNCIFYNRRTELRSTTHGNNDSLFVILLSYGDRSPWVMTSYLPRPLEWHDRITEIHTLWIYVAVYLDSIRDHRVGCQAFYTPHFTLLLRLFKMHAVKI